MIIIIMMMMSSGRTVSDSACVLSGLRLQLEDGPLLLVLLVLVVAL